MANHAQQRSAAATEIPDRLYFRIGDVARLCDVPAYVLRFWETEFPQLKPNKGGTGQRLYRRRDVEMALRIKQLVHEEGYTLAGARQVLEQGARRRPAHPQLPLKKDGGRQQAEKLARLRSELREILGMLSTPAPEEAQAAPRARLERVKSPSAPTLFE